MAIGSQSKRPNILFILADDLGWGDLSMHGSPIKTPIIDHLAREGIELTQHYVCPMCSPTRTSLLSGRYPGRFGAHATIPTNDVVFPDGYQTLPAALREAGYTTGLFGKWHLGSQSQFGPQHFGFDRSYGSLAGGIDPYNHRYKFGPDSTTWHQDGELRNDHGHVTDLLTDATISWINEVHAHNKQQPWFCYVPYTAVHVPVKPTQQSLIQYGATTFDNDPAKDASYRKYAAYTSHMDSSIGRILETLEELCIREETLVIFTSDNGAIEDCPLHHTDTYPGFQEESPRLGSNAPYRGVKAQLYEGGIRTPTIVSWRGTYQPGRCNAPTAITDWMPTLGELAHCDFHSESAFDGQSIASLFEGQSTVEKRELYWNFDQGRHLCLRSGPWKLIKTNIDTTPTIELYHLDNDPFEQHNCKDFHPDIVNELSQKMKQQRQKDGVSARTDIAAAQFIC